MHPGLRALLVSSLLLLPGISVAAVDPRPEAGAAASAHWTSRLPEPARLAADKKRGKGRASDDRAKTEAARRALGLSQLRSAGPGAFYGGPAAGRIPSTSPRDAAAKFLSAIAPAYGLTEGDLKDVAQSERPGFLPGYREIVATRTFGNLPLYGARLWIHVGPHGEFLAAVGNLYGPMRSGGAARLDGAAAAERAVTAMRRIAGVDEGSIATGSTTEVAYPLGEVAQPAWVVHDVVAPNGVDRFDVVVDAISGRILEVVARTFYAEGEVFVNGAGMPQSPQPSATPGFIPPIPNPPSYVARVTVPLTVSGTTLSGNTAEVREYQSWTGQALSPLLGNPITGTGGVFTFPLLLGTGSDIRNYPQATGTNLYRILEVAHDYFYALGFDEAHGNFQVDNFGLGGVGGDPVVAFTQLGSRTASGASAYRSDNAFMSTPEDGQSPIMGMYVWKRSGTSGTYVYNTDSALDPDIVFHEFTHGVTDRLAAGTLPYWGQSGAIHEGNSDFFALNIQTAESSPLNGTYPVSTYSDQNFTEGIRFFPYSTSLAVNPLTYADFGTVAWYGAEVHADGEIWAAALWEMRGALIDALGFEEGRTRSGQLVIDALQLLPDDPTFVDFRNAILVANDARYAGEEATALWAAFAKRGLGGLASGGADAYSLYVLPDFSEPSDAASVRFWEDHFYAGELVRVVVADKNAESASAALTTTGGDSETLALLGSAGTFEGGLPSATGTPVPADGILQVADGETITATITDADAGGGTPQLTATAGVRRPYFIGQEPASSFDVNLATTRLFGNDEWFVEVTLPFSFEFYGETFTKIWVTDNGYLSFTPPSGIRIRGLTEPGMGRVIAPFSVDLDCTAGGVYSGSSADRFTIRWGCREYWTGNPVNVAVSLYPSGQIRFHYGTGNTLTGSDYYTGEPNVATIGLVRHPDVFVQAVPSYDQAKNLASAKSVAITTEESAGPPTATVSGDAVICDGETSTISVALTGTAPWSITWSDGLVQEGIVSSPATREVSPAYDTTYSVTAVSDALWTGTATGSATIDIALPPEIRIAHQAYACTGTTQNAAAVPDLGPGVTYEWSIANGTITEGAGSHAIRFSPTGSSPVVLGIHVTAAHCALTASASVPSQDCAGVDPVYLFTHLAGSDGGRGSSDGPAELARFDTPYGVATDSAGNTYVADSANHTIRRIDVDGTATTLAGLAGMAGSNDGTASAARFKTPAGVACDSAGNVYVADTGNHVIRKITPAGHVSTVAGKAGTWGNTDGSATSALFRGPRGLAVDSTGSLFIADTGNYRIRRISPAGQVSTLAGSLWGNADGQGTQARFSSPNTLTISPTGMIYVADSGTHSIRAITTEAVVTTLAGKGWSGAVDGFGTAAAFDSPHGITWHEGALYVADSWNSTIRRITASGEVTTFAGSADVAGTEDGNGTDARFQAPSGIAGHPSGSLVVADTQNHTIRTLSVTGDVLTVAGKASVSGSVDGTGGQARFRGPAGIVIEADGNLLVSDTGNHTIRRVSPQGAVVTVAGLPGVSGSVDGEGSNARFSSPLGLAVDTSGAVYVADSSNHAIRRITAPDQVTTFAGVAGNSGTLDGPAQSSRFQRPADITFDSAGNAYISDTFNSTIRRISASAMVTTLAGQPGWGGSSDGSGSQARFNRPFGIDTIDSLSLVTADAANVTIRKVTFVGTVTTLAGQKGLAGSVDGTGSQALFVSPFGIEGDGLGNAFITDVSTLRKITTDGVVTRIGGAPTDARHADGLGPNARFVSVSAIDVAQDGTLYVTDGGNHSIRIGRFAIPDRGIIDAQTGRVDEPRQLDTAPRNATSFDWRLVRVPSPSSLAGWTATTANPVFTPDAAGRYELELKASNDAGTSISTIVLDAWVPATATVSGDANICPGATVALVADLTGTPPWNLTWSDGLVQTGVTTSPVLRSVNPSATTTWSVTAISDANGEGVPSGAATVSLSTPAATASGESICQGQTATISVELTGVAPWTIAWSDGVTQSGLTESSVTRTVTPDVTTGYTIQTLTDANCSISAPIAGASVVVTPSAIEIGHSPYACASSEANEGGVQEFGPGASYVWTIANGSITGGQGTRLVAFSADGTAPVELSITITTPAGCAITGSTSIPIQSCGDADAEYVFTHLAGSDGGAGFFDGTAADARFNLPGGVAVDLAGNAYVADARNSTIRRVTPQGVVTTVAGRAGVKGTVDGRGGAARFSSPAGVTTDIQGNVYVADQGSDTIRRISPSGEVTTFAGQPDLSGHDDGPATSATFSSPQDLVFVDGALFVTDQYNHTIRRIDADGTVSTFAGLALQPGSTDGAGSAARFNAPKGIAADGSGNLFVVDAGNYTVRKISPAGVVSTLAGLAGVSGDADGSGSGARFRSPRGIAADELGNMFVSEATLIRKITPEGLVTTFVGSLSHTGSTDGNGPDARFYGPNALAIDSLNRIIVADSGNNTIRRILPTKDVTTLAGKAREEGSMDGPPTAARFSGESGLAISTDGTVFRSASGNGSIRAVTASGDVSTLVAGLGAQYDLAVDPGGNLFVSGVWWISKVTAEGMISLLAGGSSGTADGLGSGARFARLTGIDLDVLGNAFVADEKNHSIRSVTPAGMVKTIAGSNGLSGSADGSAQVARFNAPHDLAVGPEGNVFVADTLNHTIRRIAPDGAVTTFAGHAGMEGQDDGPPEVATLEWPYGIAADKTSNLYISEWLGRIRRVDRSGNVTTVGGSGDPGRLGNVSGLGRDAWFGAFTRLNVASDGTLYVSDTSSIRTGRLAIPDRATIDASTGPALAVRQLGVAPLNATSFSWRLIRVPSTSSWPELSDPNIANPTFTPDVAGRFEFQLTASNDVGTSISIVALEAGDPVGITMSSDLPRTTTEAGGTLQFRMRLNSPPAAGVTIALSSSDTTEGTVAPASLTFTPENWSAEQTITMTGVDDADADGDTSYQLVTAPAVSADPYYAGLNPPDMTITNVDDEAACRAGDVNANGQVSAFDASLILQFVVGSKAPTTAERCAADFNGNGSVTAFDASLVLQCVVGTGPCN